MNVICDNPGPTRYSKRNVDSMSSAFQLFMRHTVLDEILCSKNKEGALVFGGDWKAFVKKELLCYIDVLLLAGVYKASNSLIDQLWNKEHGRPIFSNSMTRNRFTDISRVLRFYNSADCRQRRQADTLAPIREVFDNWEKR